LPVLLVVLHCNVFGKPVDFALHVSRYLVPLTLPRNIAVGVQSLLKKGYAWVLHVLKVIFGAFGIVLCLVWFGLVSVKFLFFSFLFFCCGLGPWCGPYGRGCPAVWDHSGVK
jgi:hypothetical protein